MVTYTIKLLQDGLYVVEQAFTLYGAELGIRMTIIRLSDNVLWLHSPVRYGENLAAQIANLGTVRSIVSPSKMHRLYLSEWIAAHPHAVHYAPVGMPHVPGSKSPTLLSQTPPKEWQGQMEQHEVQGIPDLNEVVFFHLPTRTLILTDLCFNIREGTLWTQLFFTLNGAWDRLALTRIFQRAIQDRVAFRGSIDRILRWDFDRIIVSHGEVVERDGKERFRAAFENLR
ncbi:MAG: DUF4336 domain-containing protein [Gammaproteobacteria bacterium]|nr:DUF4336 domain-containing protein [Gammaproteobacteria bacterium]